MQNRLRNLDEILSDSVGKWRMSGNISVGNLCDSLNFNQGGERCGNLPTVISARERLSKVSHLRTQGFKGMPLEPIHGHNRLPMASSEWYEVYTQYTGLTLLIWNQARCNIFSQYRFTRKPNVGFLRVGSRGWVFYRHIWWARCPTSFQLCPTTFVFTPPGLMASSALLASSGQYPMPFMQCS